ncbi:MAG: threonine-phosphate decarboxylase CobD [Parvibaculaceae bacterium]|nr:threonine-phosphate decarboxylase CobD [Parvibaculaceae bacterium]
MNGAVLSVRKAPMAHGGRLNEAKRLFPGAPEPFIDLSTGINPVPWPVPPISAEGWARLPEQDQALALEEAAARAYGVRDAGMVVAAPGTQLLISALPRIFPLASLAVLGPTYGEHAAAWRASGALVAETGDFSALERCEGAVVVNPNNPDGRRHDAQALLALATRLHGKGGLLIVDEAFADLEEGVTIAPLLPQPGVVVLRSFGKTYGLAGLRLGFALGDTSYVERIRTALGPWAVSGPALEIGRAALMDTDWKEAARTRLARDVSRLGGLLTRAGFTLAGGTHLFQLAESPEAPRWFDRLGRAGILVRAFESHPERLRFGLPGNEAAWSRLEEVLT